MNHPIDIAGSRVLITGGASGLGLELARRVALAGGEVIIWDRDRVGTARVCKEIIAAGGSARFSVVDITDRAAVDRAAAKIGDIDVLINNAGVVTGEWFIDLEPDKVERTFSVNVLALYWVTQAFLPSMLERDHGSVVTVASAAGLVGVAKQTDYSASKFAAVGFMESLRAELRVSHSDVNAMTVCPYYIDTGMFDGVRTRFRWLLPILSVEFVAGKVIESIEKGRAVLVLPWFARTLPIVRLLPVRTFDRVADFFGINKSMDFFRGRV